MSADTEPQRFRKDIEGLRAVAVLGVVAFHAGVPHLGGGYVGVDVFYVISGFLITQLMVRECGGTTRPSFGRFLAGFYARRARRILPAATLVVLTTLIGASLVQNALENAEVVGDARATTLFYSNIHFAAQASDYFTAQIAPSPFLQYWSLSLEEQFYLVWPIVFFGLLVWSRRQGSSSRVLGGWLAAIVLASFALSIVWMRTDPIRAFYLLPPRAWELGIGALLAIHEARIAKLAPRLRTTLAAVGLVAILAVMVIFSGSTPFPGWAALPPIVGAALVISGGFGDANPGIAHRILALGPMKMIGRYSFSLYLWHWPALVIQVEHFKWVYKAWPIRTAVMLALSLPAAALTYHLVENPIRRARALTSNRRALLLGAALIALGLIGVTAFQHFGNTAALSSPRSVPATAGRLGPVIIPTDFVPANLMPSLADTMRPDSRHWNYDDCEYPCLIGHASAQRRIVLFGNSHAGHWATALDVAAAALDAQLEVHAPGGCTSFLIPINILPPKGQAGCEEHRARAFASMDAKPPDIVVLSNMSGDVFEAHPAEWERGVRDAIHRIPKASTVLVFGETPRGISPSAPQCLARNVEHAERCDVKWPEAINTRLQTIAREEGAHFVELRPLFCTATRCPIITEDVLIYADSNHMTKPFARAHGAWATELLRQFLPAR